MKATIRIPTVQYGYIEFEMEVDDSPENILKVVKTHNNIIKAYEVVTPPKADTNNNDDF